MDSKRFSVRQTGLAGHVILFADFLRVNPFCFPGDSMRATMGREQSMQKVSSLIAAAVFISPEVVVDDDLHD